MAQTTVFLPIPRRPGTMTDDCLKSDFTCEIIINNLTCEIISFKHCTFDNKKKQLMEETHA